MPYSYLTFGQAKAQLAARLYDTTDSFWTNIEKGVYILQAVSAFNSLTNYWRSEFTFDTVINNPWYDITKATRSLRPLTVTTQQIVSTIQYMLLEPISGGYPLIWTGSNQFSITDILNAIQRRRDEILSTTGCYITQRNVPAIPGRTFLPDTVIDVRRVAWIPIANPSGFVNSPMLPDDEWGLQSFESDYTTQIPGTPSTYRQSTEPPLSFDTDIPPAVPGSYDVLSVDAGPLVTPDINAALNIPDDFTWVLIFGVLSDLLSKESNAKDSLRAQYCEGRYKQGLALLLTSSAILYSRIDNLPLYIDSVQNTDNFRFGWQSETPSQPDLLMTAGLNLIGLSPIPDADYQVLASVVQNAPLPINDLDKIQVGRDDLEAIIDYAQHLASFKMGGLEFMSTYPLLNRFHSRATEYNSKLNELGEFTKPMYEMSQLQAEAIPVMEQQPDNQV